MSVSKYHVQGAKPVSVSKTHVQGVKPVSVSIHHIQVLFSVCDACQLDDFVVYIIVVDNDRSATVTLPTAASIAADSCIGFVHWFHR